MTPSLIEAYRKIQSQTESIVTDSFGGKVRLGKARTFEGKDHVARFRVLEGPSRAPSSIIVKCPWGPDGDAFDPDQYNPRVRAFFRDWAGAQFLTELGGRSVPVPRFYGGNREAGILVMEDLGKDERRTDRLLLARDPSSAERALIRTWGLIGRMNAVSIRQKPLYDRIRKALGTLEPTVTIADSYKHVKSRWSEVCDRLKIVPRRGFKSDLKKLARFSANPGPFLAFTHGDACPGNDLFVKGRWKWLDFECGGFSHALSDGVFPRILFPTCYCIGKLPDRTLEKVEESYRIELEKGCPESGDDTLYFQAMTEGCATWAIETFFMITTPGETITGVRSAWQKRLGVGSNHPNWGVAALRRRAFTRMEVFVQTARSYNHLGNLADTGEMIMKSLGSLWPEDVLEMPLFPAFK